MKVLMYRCLAQLELWLLGKAVGRVSRQAERQIEYDRYVRINHKSADPAESKSSD